MIDDTSPYYDDLMNLVDTSKMTVKDIKKVWAGVGFTVKYDMPKNVTVWDRIKNFFTREYQKDAKGNLFKIASVYNSENSEIIDRKEDNSEPVDTGKDTDAGEEKKIDDNPVIERFHVINKYLDK